MDLDACVQAVEEDRTDFCAEPGAPATAWRDLADKYGINRPAGRLFVNPTSATWFFAFNHNRPAFEGPGQIPLKKAINYAIDRPALARTFGYLGGKRTDQLLPTCVRPHREHLPARGREPVSGAALVREGAASSRPGSSSIRWNFPHTVVQAQILAFNLKQLGIDLDVKYFDPDTVFERIRTSGEPFDIVVQGWGARLSRRRRDSSCRC